jgi:putative ABC transport system permease protein
LPFAQRPFWITSFVIRTSVNPGSLAGAVRREVTAMAPTVPVLGIETMETLLQRSFAESSYRTLLLGLLSLLALILAAVGLYGLLAYTVSRRTHEIGIRMALGADRALVLRFVLGHGVRLTLLGVVIGLVLSVATTRFLTTLLFNVSATDPLTLGGTSALLLIVAILACWIPSRRATRVDPLVALRCD